MLARCGNLWLGQFRFLGGGAEKEGIPNQLISPWENNAVADSPVDGS